MSDEEQLKTAPVIKWAQSLTQIFISFKLSHRQDSPTCSDIRKEYFLILAVWFQQQQVGTRMTAEVFLEASFHARLDQGPKGL